MKSPKARCSWQSLLTAGAFLFCLAAAPAAQDSTWQDLSGKRGDLPAPPGGSTQQTGAVVADFDGDGDLDLLNKPYNWDTTRVDVWLNNGTGPRITAGGAPRTTRHDLTPLHDASRVLVNPHKGWYHHYPDNHTDKYAIARDADLLEFCGMDHFYIRLAWAHLEPREDEFNWPVIDRVIDRWTAHGLGIAFRISCRETSSDRGGIACAGRRRSQCAAGVDAREPGRRAALPAL